MRPSSSRLPRSSSARSLSSCTQQQGRAPSKPAELLRALPPFSRSDEALAAPSPASLLDSPRKQVHRAAPAPPADHAALRLGAGDSDALLGASQALTRLLDATAAAIAAASSHVPSFVQGVLARLFPAASSISAAMPSPDGQALAVTTLLHPAAAALGAAAAVHHSEPLGPDGVCSFHLAEAPSGESLRLMRTFMHHLGRRLEEQQAEQLGAWQQTKMPGAGMRAAYACAALPLDGRSWSDSLESCDSMPADCFWESM